MPWPRANGSNGASNGRPATRTTMVVGFDTRFLSDRYALEVARVLAANGFTVHLTHADVPTPAISLAVRDSWTPSAGS